MNSRFSQAMQAKEDWKRKHEQPQDKQPEQTCPICDGFGYFEDHEICQRCHGYGKVKAANDPQA